LEYIKQISDSHRVALDMPAETNARQAAIFVDEKTASYTSMRHRGLNYDLVDNPMRAFLNSGVSLGVYQLEDVLDDRLAPPAVCAFLNATTLTPEYAAMIRKKLGNNHRVLVWVWAPGIYAPGGSANPSKITGFDLVQDDAVFGRLIQFDKGADPLLKDLTGILGVPLWDDVPRYRVADLKATPLAYYVGTTATGLAVKRYGSHTEVFIGQPGGFTPTFVRNLVREAGETPINDGDAVVFCGAGVLTVHATKDGKHSFMLPKNVTEVTCLTGQSCTFAKGKLELSLPGGHTACFKLGTESQAKNDRRIGQKP